MLSLDGTDRVVPIDIDIDIDIDTGDVDDDIVNMLETKD
jgi:hypothetical protein